jgi:hypothetical protein
MEFQAIRFESRMTQNVQGYSPSEPHEASALFDHGSVALNVTEAAIERYQIDD